MTRHSTPAATGDDQHPDYLAILNEQLERRRRDHGQAFLTPREDAWLRARGLRKARTYANLRPFDEVSRAHWPGGNPATA